MPLSLNDVAKDCVDAFRRAEVYVERLLDAQRRLLMIEDMHPADGPAAPALMRYCGCAREEPYRCFFCGDSARMEALCELSFMPAYLAACCGACAEVI